MTLSDIPEERKAQLTAIEIELATAKKYIRDDLKAKFGYEKNKFFDLDLIEYRINNSCEDIAEDLDVKSLYGIESDKITEEAVGFAFRGYHNEEFMPDYRFDGLLGKETNDYIKNIRKGLGSRATVETHGDQIRNCGLVSRGRGYWQTRPERLEDIFELKYGKGLSWNDTTAEMNEKYGEDYTTKQVIRAYQNNKDLLSDEEE